MGVSATNILGLHFFPLKTTTVSILRDVFNTIWQVQIEITYPFHYPFHANLRNLSMVYFDREITNQGQIFCTQKRNKFTTVPEFVTKYKVPERPCVYMYIEREREGGGEAIGLFSVHRLFCEYRHDLTFNPWHFRSGYLGSSYRGVRYQMCRACK